MKSRKPGQVPVPPPLVVLPGFLLTCVGGGIGVKPLVVYIIMSTPSYCDYFGSTRNISGPLRGQKRNWYCSLDCTREGTRFAILFFYSFFHCIGIATKGQQASAEHQTPSG
jgi:hypothetical protein